MPEPNLRMALVGAPRADREFTTYLTEEARAEKDAEVLAREAERAEREVKRALRDADQALRRAARGR